MSVRLALFDRREATVPTFTAPAGVRVRGLAKRYGDGTLALDGIALDCPAGEITVLVGPSGCGKTTLLRTIAGLETPTSGSIVIDGHDVTGREPQTRGVAMVFQSYGLYPDKSAHDNIAFPLQMARVPKPERARRVKAVARLLRIEELLDRKPAQLSGGQRQRVGIGRALVRGPRVLLMDEPLSNLDAQLRVQMRSELLSLQRELGTTMIYVTHDQIEALTLGSTVVVMNAGKVAQAGPPHEVYARPENPFVAGFLGGMNLLEGVVRRGELVVEPACVSLPAQLHHLDGRRIVLGVRPEALTRGEPGPDDLGFAAPVTLTELLGSDQLVHLGTAPAVLRMREEAQPVTDLALRVRAASRDVHVFLPEPDGRRIEPA